MTDTMLISLDDALLSEANGGRGFQFGAGLSINDHPVVGATVGASAGDGALQVGGAVQVGRHQASGGFSLGFF